MARIREAGYGGGARHATTYARHWPQELEDSDGKLGLRSYYAERVRLLAQLEEQAKRIGPSGYSWGGGGGYGGGGALGGGLGAAGGLRRNTQLNESQRKQLAELQIQIAEMREEKNSLERLIPALMRNAQNDTMRVMSGELSATEVAVERREGRSDLDAQFRAAMTGQPGARTTDPMAHEAIRTEWGPGITDEQINAIFKQTYGLPSELDLQQQRVQMANVQNQMDVRNRSFDQGQANWEAQQSYGRGQDIFANQQSTFRNQAYQQGIMGTMANQIARNQTEQWELSRPWMMPAGTEYQPLWEPGGILQQLAERLGVAFTPRRATPYALPDPYEPYRRMGVAPGRVPQATPVPAPGASAPGAGGGYLDPLLRRLWGG